MMFNLMIVGGVAMLAWSLRTFANPILFKLGTICVFATAFFAGWLFFGNVWVGVVSAGVLLFAPWLEFLLRVRKLRFAASAEVGSILPPGRERFPMLGELTESIEKEGFRHVDDVGWTAVETKHFCRVFYHEKKGCRAMICLLEQEDFSFFFLEVYSCSADGKRREQVWNFPFVYTMPIPAGWEIELVGFDEGFAGLFEIYQERFGSLVAGDVAAGGEYREEEACEEIRKALREQVEYNLQEGILADVGDGKVRYSFRGLVYLWGQFLKDLVRL